MIRVLVKTCDLLRRKAATEREDEVVVRHLALNFAMCERRVAIAGTNPRHLSFDEANAAIRHRFA